MNSLLALAPRSSISLSRLTELFAPPGCRVPDYRREITLRDGRTAIVRPICSEDKQDLQGLHKRLSQDTLFLRYHYSKGQLTEQDLRDFCDLDYHDQMGLVVEMEIEGKKQIVAVGRYIHIPSNHTAEVAFVVQDDLQNNGIGTQLLKHLAILARERDVHYFFGEVLRQNSKMLSIFRKSDPRIKMEVDSSSTCTIKLSTEEAAKNRY